MPSNVISETDGKSKRPSGKCANVLVLFVANSPQNYLVEGLSLVFIKNL